MTSEWTQRSALTTFTLAPRRLPVFAAKYVSAMILSLGVLVGWRAVGDRCHCDRWTRARSRHYGGMLTDIRSFAIVVVLQVTMAAAFGALAAQTAVALVAYLVAPTAVGRRFGELFKGASPWFDVFSAYNQLSSGQPFHNLAQSLTSIARVGGACPACSGRPQPAQRGEVTARRRVAANSRTPGLDGPVSLSVPSAALLVQNQTRSCS